MHIEGLIVINRSGGLVYHGDFRDAQSRSISSLDSNDHLILASTLHGVSALASQLTPRALQLGATNNSGTSGTNSITGTILGSGANDTAIDASHQSDTTGQLSGTVPYIPMQEAAPGTTQLPMGTYRGQDYFQGPSFSLWARGGLRELHTDEFSLYQLQTPTGIQFVAVTSAGTRDTAKAYNFLRRCYCVYADYVLKDPFYTPEMPVKPSAPFDQIIRQVAQRT